MDPRFLETPAWGQALTLRERIAARCAPSGILPGERGDADRALRRLERWRAQTPFRTESYFSQRLAADGLTEEEFLSLLREPPQAFPPSAIPKWLVELARAFAAPATPVAEPLPWPERGPAPELAGLLALAEPLIRRARARLRVGLRALTRDRSDFPFDVGTIEGLLLANLPGQLLLVVSRTLVLELHVARLQGFLRGDTPGERFQSFVERLRRPEVALALFQEYPVLARQLMIHLDHWVRGGLEFLRRLSADWAAILATFRPEDPPGHLAEVKGGVGDRHRDGRAVLLATFQSGWRLVYKPRSLAIDVHVQELLDWLNVRGTNPPFRTLKILDRGTYGWAEFVSAGGCRSPEEVWRFYERQGGYLALLYALEATDFHSENLIAAGEHPVLIDLESLFHPRAEAIDLTRPDEPAEHAIAHSVLRAGLLPQRLWADAESEGIDPSGVGATAGQLTPGPVPTWKAPGTDEMRLTRERRALPGAENRPTLNGAEVQALDYTEAIVAGFTSLYRLLLEHREELLADDGALARFAQDEVRVILRPTRAYGLLLQESFHPDLLRDALERDCWFDRLWVGVEPRPQLTPVVPAEQADLLKGDIPFFTTHPTSRDLWTSTNERVTDFFAESGLSLVRQRLDRFGEPDLRQQLWFIRAAMTSLSRRAERAPGQARRPTEPQTPASREKLLAAARAVGDRLDALALHGAGEVGWLGLVFDNHQRWALRPAGLDLYDGLPGIALFLAYLGALTGEMRYTTLAQAASTTFRHQLERGRSSFACVGGFEGWGGVIYTLTHLAALWGQTALLEEARGMVEFLPLLIERDEQLDVIGGSAGCIGGLLGLHRWTPGGSTLAAAVQCGERLLARAQPAGRGIGWLTRTAGTRPLTGFSHGAAGMAWALAELAAVSGDERFRTAAQAAVAYERGLFRAEAGNWPDLRGGEERFMTAWCHGAAGVGLARLHLLSHLGEEESRAEIDAALRTTLAQGFGHNHCLCHGDLGNLELLLQAGETLGEPHWQTRTSRLAAAILEGAEEEGWRCGNPLGVETPGLMTGLAGIGYGLLRLAEPTRVPSVLLMMSPTRPGATPDGS